MLCVCTGLAAGGCETKTSDSDIRPITLAEVQRLAREPDRDALLLVDPRAPGAYAKGHVPGARSVQISVVSGKAADRDPALEKYQNIVVYGDDPASPPARAMTKRMMSAGYSEVYMFMGGLGEWDRAGLPVATGSSPGGSVGKASGAADAGKPAAR